MNINDEDAKLLFDIDGITARLDMLFVKYAQSTMAGNYKGTAHPEKVQPDIESLRENTLKALAGLEALQMALAAQKAAVAELIVQNNRILWGALQRGTSQDEPSE